MSEQKGQMRAAARIGTRKSSLRLSLLPLFPFCSVRTPAPCMINVPLIWLCLFSATIVERKRRLARESFFKQTTLLLSP